MIDGEIIEISYSIIQLFNYSPFKIGKEAFLVKETSLFYRIAYVVTDLLHFLMRIRYYFYSI